MLFCEHNGFEFFAFFADKEKKDTTRNKQGQQIILTIADSHTTKNKTNRQISKWPINHQQSLSFWFSLLSFSLLRTPTGMEREVGVFVFYVYTHFDHVVKKQVVKLLLVAEIQDKF